MWTLGPVSSCRQPAKWRHDWRVLVRHAALIHGTSHRREFADLSTFAIDELKTMAYHRSLPAGRHKAALEVVLSGALLTGIVCHGPRILLLVRVHAGALTLNGTVTGSARSTSPPVMLSGSYSQSWPYHTTHWNCACWKLFVVTGHCQGSEAHA